MVWFFPVNYFFFEIISYTSSAVRYLLLDVRSLDNFNLFNTLIMQLIIQIYMCQNKNFLTTLISVNFVPFLVTFSQFIMVPQSDFIFYKFTFFKFIF